MPSCKPGVSARSANRCTHCLMHPQNFKVYRCILSLPDGTIKCKICTMPSAHCMQSMSLHTHYMLLAVLYYTLPACIFYYFARHCKLQLHQTENCKVWTASYTAGQQFEKVQTQVQVLKSSNTVHSSLLTGVHAWLCARPSLILPDWPVGGCTYQWIFFF